MKSRIIVAAGGGGAVSVNISECVYFNESETDLLCEYQETDILNDYKGGPGGSLFGYRVNDLTIPGSQTGKSFGKGLDGISLNLYTFGTESFSGGSTGGGGGGYFGGITKSDLKKTSYIHGGGAGGSSYVSGCIDCKSVNYLPLNDCRTSSNPVHYSNYIFKKIEMVSGINEMPLPYIDQTDQIEIGHSGNGAVKITYLGPFQQGTCICQRHITFNIIYIIILIILKN